MLRLTAILLSFSLPLQASAATYSVCSNLSLCDFDDILDAYNATAAGDRIEVQPGTYSVGKVKITRDNIALIGLSGSASTFITTPSNEWVELDENVTGVHIEGFTVTPAAGEPRYLSIKNLAGATFGNHGYGGGFVAKQGPDGLTIEAGKGPGDTDAFVEALGIDKELAAEGYTNYATQNPDSPPQWS